MPLIAERKLAERIERSVVADLTRYAETCRTLDPALPIAMERLGGGLALYLAPGSPINMIFGAGFDGALTPAEVAAAERFYAERDTHAAISLSPLADEGLLGLLGMRGWIATDFENVLALPLPGFEPPPASAGVSVRVARSAEERSEWARVSAGAASAPEAPSAEETRLGLAGAAREDMTLLLGCVDGEPAGAGALWLDGGLGWMLADATLPHLRGRGVQSALLAERCRLAQGAGCDLGVTEARPGSTSQRNMQRLGYSVVYTRVELIGPPPVARRDA